MTLREHSTCWTWKVRKALSRQLSNLWYTPSWKLGASPEISNAKNRKRKLTSSRVEKSTVPPLDETTAASCIAQIGEEGLSETEAVGSFNAMNEQRKRTLAQAQEPATRGSLRLPQTVTGHRKISVLDRARRTGVFAVRTRAMGRPSVPISSTARMERLPPTRRPGEVSLTKIQHGQQDLWGPPRDT